MVFLHRNSKPVFITSIVIVFAAVCFCMPAFAAKKINDKDIKEAVEDQVLLDRVAISDGVDVFVTNGIVTLSGKIENLLMKKRVGKIAEMVKGVRSVVNNINVVPAALRTDTEIKDDVKEALLLDPAADAYELKVTVADGVVTLTGDVQSWQERTLAEKVASGVKGVREVLNGIAVNYANNRSDSEIKNDIEQSMRWNVLLDDALIDVSVKQGKVTLSGVVGSVAEKDEAFNLAMIAGVRSVDTTELRVEKWARNDDFRKNKYVVKSKKDIEKAIKDSFLFDPRVYSFKIDVEAKPMGEITLRGAVDNLKAKRAAAQDARNTVGVYYVKNRIKVKPQVTISDKKIAANVRKALIMDPIVDGYEVTVDATNGIVDLYGTVDTYYEKAQADDVASTSEGVIGVDNNIIVSEPYRPYAYDPYLDDWYIYGYNWYAYQPRRTAKSDIAIENDIESEFFWSPFVDGDDVDVDVKDGIAILTGEVDSWSEFYSAQKNAFEGGAIDVKNELEVNSTSG